MGYYNSLNAHNLPKIFFIIVILTGILNITHLNAQPSEEDKERVWRAVQKYHEHREQYENYKNIKGKLKGLLSIDFIELDRLSAARLKMIKAYKLSQILSHQIKRGIPIKRITLDESITWKDTMFAAYFMDNSFKGSFVSYKDYVLSNELLKNRLFDQFLRLLSDK